MLSTSSSAVLLALIVLGLICMFCFSRSGVRERLTEVSSVSISELEFMVGVAENAYNTGDNVSEIVKFAKENQLVFSPSRDAYTNTQTNISLIRLQSQDLKTLYISFRGTIPTSYLNIVEDIDWVYSSFYGSRVSSGFLRSWRSVRRTVMNMVNSSDADVIYVVGHSLGASIATLAAVDIKITTGREPVLYTFASPRTGDRSFVSLFRKIIGEGYRVEGIDDPVPRFPLRELGYRHVPTQILLQPGKCTIGTAPPTNYPFDITYHFLGAYRKLLASASSCE